MWPLPPSEAIPLTNPFGALSVLEALAVATILLAGAMVFLLARLTIAGHEFRTVTCPIDGVRARTLLGRASSQASLRVVYCSRWHVRTATCDRSCLPRAA